MTSTDGRKKRLVLISSIQPAKTRGGSLVLYRHLMERSDFEILTIGPEEVQRAQDELLDRIFKRLHTTRLHKLSFEYETLYKYRSLDSNIKMEVDRFSPDAVLTVAQGPLCLLAKRVADSLHVPLISIFHDWWPSLAKEQYGVSARTVRGISKSFRKLYRSSQCVLPVCDEMASALGPHSNSTTVFPVGSFDQHLASETESYTPKSLVYLGNMSVGYGAMIRALLDISVDSSFSVFFAGDTTDWCPDYKAFFQQKCMLSAGHILDAEMLPYLSNALALLVTLPFTDIDPIISQTSFPSKLVSYMNYGRPIIFWAPPDSSLVKWARKHGASAVFDKQDPTELCEFVSRLNANVEQQKILIEESKKLASLFQPVEIHKTFCNAIEATINRHRLSNQK